MAEDDAAGAEARVRLVCVYCGSKAGASPLYAKAAEELGREIARRGLGLVYGGGTMGLMGVVARAGAVQTAWLQASQGNFDNPGTWISVLLPEVQRFTTALLHALQEAENGGKVAENGGKVLGIIPGALIPREVSGGSVGEVVVVKDMHERKARMAKEADAFIALPGGFGTLEELLEMVTWSQLGIHGKAVGVLNVEGFYDTLLQFFDQIVDRGFAGSEIRESILSSGSPKELIDLVLGYEAKHEAVVSKESWDLGYRCANDGAP